MRPGQGDPLPCGGSKASQQVGRQVPRDTACPGNFSERRVQPPRLPRSRIPLAASRLRGAARRFTCVSGSLHMEPPPPRCPLASPRAGLSAAAVRERRRVARAAAPSPRFLSYTRAPGAAGPGSSGRGAARAPARQRGEPRRPGSAPLPLWSQACVSLCAGRSAGRGGRQPPRVGARYRFGRSPTAVAGGGAGEAGPGCSSRLGSACFLCLTQSDWCWRRGGRGRRRMGMTAVTRQQPPPLCRRTAMTSEKDKVARSRYRCYWMVQARTRGRSLRAETQPQPKR